MWIWMISSEMEQASLYPRDHPLEHYTGESTTWGGQDAAGTARGTQDHVRTRQLTVNSGIAWSAWGSIASITADGMGVELRNPRCHPDTGEWGLSKPETLPPLSSNHDGGPLQHLVWSPNGQELAIIDASGRISVVQLFNSLNKINVYRSNQLDAADDLHEVVGFSWLNPPLANRNVSGWVGRTTFQSNHSLEHILWPSNERRKPVSVRASPDATNGTNTTTFSWKQ